MARRLEPLLYDFLGQGPIRVCLQDLALGIHQPVLLIPVESPFFPQWVNRSLGNIFRSFFQSVGKMLYSIARLPPARLRMLMTEKGLLAHRLGMEAGRLLQTGMRQQ